MGDRNEKVEELVLETLSFYEPMSFELILLDMPRERILDIPNFNREDLEKALSSLKESKKIKELSLNSKNEICWIKVFPKKGLIKRIYSFLS